MLKDPSTKNEIITYDDYFDLKVDGKNITVFLANFMDKQKYKYGNIYINNFTNFIGMCETLKKYQSKKINIILDGVKLNDEINSKDIVKGFKLLPENYKISYRKLNDKDEVEDKEFKSLNPWLSNLSKDDFAFMATKFNLKEQKYVLKQEQIIKHVHSVLCNTYDSFDELENEEKLDIIYDYLNKNIKITDDDNDFLETAINKKGSRGSVRDLFMVLTNNRYMKLKTEIKYDKVFCDKLIFNFYMFLGKQDIKKTR